MLRFRWNLILFVHGSAAPWEAVVNKLLLGAPRPDGGVRRMTNCFALPKREQKQNTSSPLTYADFYFMFLNNYLSGLGGESKRPSRPAVSTIASSVALNNRGQISNKLSLWLCLWGSSWLKLQVQFFICLLVAVPLLTGYEELHLMNCTSFFNDPS